MPAETTQATAPTARTVERIVAVIEEEFGEVLIVSMWFLLHWMNQHWG
jgi:hypothetical protein